MKLHVWNNASIITINHFICFLQLFGSCYFFTILCDHMIWNVQPPPHPPIHHCSLSCINNVHIVHMPGTFSKDYTSHTTPQITPVPQSGISNAFCIVKVLKALNSLVRIIVLQTFNTLASTMMLEALFCKRHSLTIKP